MKKLLLSIAIMSILVSCSPVAANLSNADAVETAVTLLQQTQAAEKIMSDALATAQASMATATPEPTATPTIEPTPAPQPFELTGSTPNIFSIEKWTGPALVHIKYEGYSNFIVDCLDANNTSTTFMGLANEIGYFEGWRLIDTQGKHSTRIQVDHASGPYTLEFFPVDPQYVHSMDVPGKYTGQTPDLILLNGAEPDLITFVYNGGSNFIVDALDENLQSVSIMGLVNEIGAFEGTKLVPSRTKYIYISHASGPYSIDIQEK